VPIAFVVWGGVTRVRKIDELQRRIELEGAIFGSRAMFLACVSIGFLQNVGVPQLNAFFFAVLTMALGVLGTAIARWNYR